MATSKETKDPVMQEEETQAAPVVVDPDEELVAYTAPLMGGENYRDVFVAVNGESLRIKRGETVHIKRKFLNVLQQAAQQEYAAWQMMEKAQDSGRAAIADM